MEGGAMVPYHLCEEQGWELRVDELHRALHDAKGFCNPMALYVINPGNPTGMSPKTDKFAILVVVAF